MGKTRSNIQVTRQVCKTGKRRKGEKSGSKWSLCRTLTRERESSKRFQSYNQEVFMAISGAKANNTNIIKKRKEGMPEIKEASH